MKIKKILWITLGIIGLGIGAVGAVLPMLPAFPFLLLAVFSFGKSSEKLHKWFIGTKFYKNNLESYVKGQGMTLAHQNQGYDHCYMFDGVRLFYDVPQGFVYPLCHPRWCMGIPYRVLHLGCKNL